MKIDKVTRAYREPAMSMKRYSFSFQLKSSDCSAHFSLDMSIFVNGESVNISEWADSRAVTVVAILESRESVRLASGVESSGLAMAPDVISI